jgi:cellulose synthase/poly-beta-1,6-N-acetylglucosamine synthase-like glycosyltransferase
VQAQWGHLNHDESALTLAQSLWVDDHHTLQMSWRSAMWRFVNFTGTAGVLRASAIDAAGGWRAASLVEDCESSFRHLVAGYRTKFVKEIVAPAELPATHTAYKAQQKRWTQGWVQLARLHLSTLLIRYQCSWPKRLHLLYHMGISWQWPAWAAWITLLPFLIHTGHWFGSFGITPGLMLYLMPSVLLITVVTWMVLFARNGIWWCALGAACVAVCLLALFFPSLAAVIRHGSDPSGFSPRRGDGDEGGTPYSA